MPASAACCPGPARPGPAVECLVVDDDPTPPLADQHADLVPVFVPNVLRVLRQANAGSAAARSHGLREATGEFVQFLDSDDLIHPAKLAAHLAAMRATGAELSYSDQATARPYDPLVAGDNPPLVDHQTLPTVSTPWELFVGVQTAPHVPVFRRDALTAALADPIVSPSRVYEPAGDTWLFFNCGARPWRVTKVDGYYAIYINHDDALRHSTKWEKTGVSALGITLAFALRCPATPATEPVRAAIGAAAFQGYRRLPRHFHAEYERLTLKVYQTSPPGASPVQMGGRRFGQLSAVLGPTVAAKLLRRVQCGEYAACQTIPRPELDALFEAILRHTETVCGADTFRARFER